MAKTFREFVAEVARPVAGDEIDFLNKHVKIILDYPIDVEDQFTGGDISKFTRLADYKPGQDAEVYEGNIDLEGEEAINDAEEDRHEKQEYMKKVVDESCDDDDELKEAYVEILCDLSEENLQYALDNGINLVDFAKTLI